MTGRRRTIRLAVLGLFIAAAGAAAGPIYVQYQAWQAERAYRKGDGDTRRTALRLLGRLDTSRSRRVIREALTDPMPMARTAAANAVFAGRYANLADDLWAAVQRETDSQVRGDMILLWSQLVGVLAEPRLRELTESPDLNVRLGTAKGLLRLGETAAAKDVFAFAADADRFRRRDAQKELLLLARPMGVMIGQPIGTPDDKAGRWSRQYLEELQSWWQVHVTPRLLKDYLAWRYDKPGIWKKVDQLLHEWRTRAPGFLRSVEDEGEEP